MTGGEGEASAAVPLRASVNNALGPRDEKRAVSWLEDLRVAADEAGCAEALADILGEQTVADFVAAVMDESRFLRQLMLDDPGRLARILDSPPDEVLEETIAKLRRPVDVDGVDAAMALLRRCRGDVALLVALADLAGAWSTERAMEALSVFAEMALDAAAATALRAEHNAGKITLADADDPQRDSGWIILAMGKLGAGELNYSSDVDLIVLFDPAAPLVADDDDPSRLYIRLTRNLIRLLSEHTEDGYVMRVDLRLRPDPGSTAVAISVPAALLYYEDQGQNWERAALIKARPIAGDRAAGDDFLGQLAPFLWRKYLDYAAIADIHSIKRQIHDHRGHGTIAIAGHNIKLGRGGIREIEFFVQTQQLIAGGRAPALRGRATLPMLAALAKEGWVDERAARELSAAYLHLRHVEHRLQMVDDQQTHTLPDDDSALAGIALLSGADGEASFETKLRAVLETTQRHYSKLFEEAPTLSAGAGNLVFTGDEDDPDTLRTLTEMGFADPALVSGLVRGWHYGRYPATRSATARERLTEIVPAMLDVLAKDRGDGAVVKFDAFLSQMPAGLQLFSLLGSNPWLLSLLADILGAAPRLADLITRRPHAFDAIIDPAFFGGLPDRATLEQHLRQSMQEARSYEDSLDRMRIFGQEQALLIGARLLAGAIEPVRAGHAFADLADILVAEALDVVRVAIEAAHGRMPKGDVAVVALGKLGGREMTAASDLDLILLYDFADGAPGSDGERSLSGGQYYARLTQRLVAALSVPTGEGRLYEVDFRLRPSGHSGPLATSIDSFASYQKSEAWTWEHLALTRARVVAGDKSLARKATAAIGEIIAQKRQPKKLVADVVEMRRTIETEKGHGGLWDIKLAPGGLIDIEFVAQYLQLRYGSRHPDIIATETEICLSRAAAAKLLSAKDADILLPALRLYHGLTQLIRLCVDEPFRPDDAPEGLKLLLARTAEVPDFARLEAHLGETQLAVRAAFESVVGEIGES